MLTRTEVLGLRVESVGSAPQRLRGLVQRLVTLLGELSAAPTPSAGDLPARTAQLRLSLQGALGVDDLVTVADEAVGMCAGVIQVERRERAAAAAELTSLLAVIREAVATIAGEEKRYSTDVSNSTARLEALQRIPNLDLLKRRLLAEVGQLKSVATAREERWRATVAGFEQRVAALEQELEDTTALATLDPLTGVDNRRGIETSFASLKTGARSLVLALIDLDDFKAVNDTLGHAAGDQVLIRVATTLRESVRSGDVVGRLGGDEFVLLLDGLTLRQAEPRLRSILLRLTSCASGCGAGGDDPVAVSACCGVAELSAGDTLPSLLQRADAALYTAKRMGKGSVFGKEAPLLRDLMKR